MDCYGKNGQFSIFLWRMYALMHFFPVNHFHGIKTKTLALLLLCWFSYMLHEHMWFNNVLTACDQSFTHTTNIISSEMECIRWVQVYKCEYKLYIFKCHFLSKRPSENHFHDTYTWPTLQVQMIPEHKFKLQSILEGFFIQAWGEKISKISHRLFVFFSREISFRLASPTHL